MNFLKHPIILYYLPVLLWTTAIFIFSSQPVLPGPEIISLDFIFKKSAHMFVFGVLFFLIYRSLVYNKQNILKATLMAAILTTLYAMSDEYHQSFIQGRTASMRDVMFDGLGMFMAWLKIHDYI